MRTRKEGEIAPQRGQEARHRLGRKAREGLRPVGGTPAQRQEELGSNLALPSSINVTLGRPLWSPS